MMWKAHLALGGVFGVVGAAFAPEASAPIILASLGSSLLPDLDHPQSKLGRRVRPLSDIIYHVLGHRGATHSVAFAILLPALLAFVYWPVALGVFLGITSHLFADGISFSSGTPLTTKGAGVPAAWPMSKEHVGIRIVPVDGMLENLIVLPLSVLMALGIGAVVF